MNLVYKENYITRLRYLIDNRTDTLLKVAAVFRSGYHSGKVESKYTLIKKNIRNIARNYSLSQSLNYCRFTDSRLAYKTGIVFGAAAKYLNNPLNFLAPADNRVDFSLAGSLGKVSAELFERRRFSRSLALFPR